MLDKQRYSQLSSARSFSIAVGLLVRGLTHQLTLQILVVDVDSIKKISFESLLNFYKVDVRKLRQLTVFKCFLI